MRAPVSEIGYGVVAHRRIHRSQENQPMNGILASTLCLSIANSSARAPRGRIRLQLRLCVASRSDRIFWRFIGTRAENKDWR